MLPPLHEAEGIETVVNECFNDQTVAKNYSNFKFKH